jgi:hypothetical protein
LNALGLIATQHRYKFWYRIAGNLTNTNFSTTNQMPSTKYTKKEIVYVDPLHTAKTLVLVYLSFSVPIVLLALFVAFVRDGELPGFTVISALILNALIGFGLLWLACKVYNWVADRFGGIEVAVKETTVNDTKPPTAQD